MSDEELGLPPWEGPAVGLLDLDAFFASVEQLDHPEWRGKPVIVGGPAEERGVVSTASYEARRYGVHSAMPSAQARRLCPDAIWTTGNFERYAQVSRAVMACLEDETPLVEQVSIDEAFFDVTPGRFSHEHPVRIVERVQRRVAELGVTCSIGLSTSKTVAKIASEKQKPRGCTVVWPGSEEAFLEPLPVRAMSGIGPAGETRLKEQGIRTLGQLASAKPNVVARAMGSLAQTMQARARGVEISEVTERAAEREVKSVSNERTYATDLHTTSEVRAALAQLCEMVGVRLRAKGLAGHTVTVRVRHEWGDTHTASRTCDKNLDDEVEIFPVARELLSQLWREGEPVRLMGVGVSGFGPVPPRQASLFDDNEQDDKSPRTSVSRTLDSLRERFGDDAVRYGRDLRLGVRRKKGEY